MESLQNDFSKKELELSSIKSDYETMKAHGDSQLEKEQALRDTLSAKDQTVKTLQKEV